MIASGNPARPVTPGVGYLVSMFAAVAVIAGGCWLYAWIGAANRYQDALGGAQAARALYAETVSNDQLDDLVAYAHAARPASWEESANVVAAFVRSGFSDPGIIRGLIDAAAQGAGLPYARTACDLASAKRRRVQWNATTGLCSIWWDAPS